ncbi:MAG: hypothetical protein ABIT37_12055 [Luteolibacter sp.]
MANDHPFQMLFETLGRIPASHAESVNRQAYEILSDILTVPVEKNGRCILLRAPRAGHGKTHLLSRIQHYLGSTHEFIPLHPAFGCRIDAASVTDDTLRRLVRPLPASGGLCVLDLVTRRLFAAALQPLVGSGEVPCQDREGALTALRTRPIETFDFHHPNAVTAHWARENFEVLGQRLSMELAQRCALPVREIAFWVDALFRFAATPVENSGRVRALAESVHAGGAADGESMERLEALLGLLSQLMRVVLVADDLEGFSADETAALRLAAFLGSLRQSVERLDVILSLNQDIWQSAFLPRLSGGLADRLSEVVIELDPLTETEMVALLDSRVPGLGSRVLDKIDVKSAGTHARGLIRAAGMAWLKATAMDSAHSPEPTVVVEAPALPVFNPPPLIAEVAERVIETPVIEPVVEAPEPAPEVVETPAPSPFEAMAETAPVFEATPAVEKMPPLVDEPVVWPAAEFSPSEPIEVIAEPVVETAVDSPFQISTPEPEPEPVTPVFTSPEWQPAPQPVEVELAPAAQTIAEPVTSWQPQVDSPFQVATPEFTPEPAPVQEFNPPPVQPTQEFNPPPAQTFFQPAQEFNPPPVQSPFQPAQEFNPPSTQSPFQPAQEFNPPPVQSPFQPSQEFNPPVESPFQFAPPVSSPEPQSATFAPSPWQETQPAAAFQLQADSPFQFAQPAPEPVPQSQNFMPAAAPAFQASPEPVFAPPVQPVESTPPPAAPDTDRVDDLLRQFRERYGRGSL